jgi:hypothetical protein
MIFVDGLGLADTNPKTNPVSKKNCPALSDALQHYSIPIDATLGISGIPQSATGQTALLTGINAPKTVGRHIEGFPGPSLRKIITKNNIFTQLKQANLSSTFANGYLAETTDQVTTKRIKSVTTVASLAAFGDVRRRNLLESDQAVAHDITRDTLYTRGYTGPLITPQQAAHHLIRIAESEAFTLFEYFLTDRAGHSADFDKARDALGRLDSFLAEIMAEITDRELTLVLTSDHGNIEELSCRSHTTNPVPLLAYGPAAGTLQAQATDLTDITPAIVSLLTSSKTAKTQP